MKTSVIIPFFNSEATIGACVDGLLQQKVPPHEIILVDNNSNDRSAEIIQGYVEQNFQKLIYVIEPRQGPAFARNCGASHAKGDVLAFIDADCVPSPDWIENLQEAFNDSEVDVVAGRILPHSLRTCLDKFHALFTMQGFSENRRFRKFNLVEGGFPTANLAIRRHVFDDVHGFDESLEIYSEDYDLCARIYNAGFSIWYSNEICVYHQHRHSIGGTLQQSFGFGTGHACNLKKHFKKLVIIEWPGNRIVNRRIKARLWLNFSSADKKILALAALSIFWPPVAWLIVFYIGYALRQIGKKLEKKGYSAAPAERLFLLFLLFAKSFALSTGRIYGSLKYSVVCF